MKLLPVAPLTVLRKSSSGLAVQVTALTVTDISKARMGGKWLPLSCVIICEGKVVAVADWLRTKHRFAPDLATK